MGKLSSKLVALPLIIIVALLSLALIRPATAALPEPGQPKLNRAAQSSGVTLEKSVTSDVVALGSVVSYTISIQNDSERTIKPSLVDQLPDGMSLLTQMVSGLQTTSISTTVGTVEVEDKTIVWSGTLAPGEAATIIYPAISPTTSEPGQSLENVATLQFGDTTLEAAATVTTIQPELGIWGRFVNSLAWILVTVNNVLVSLGISYSFGFAIILFTVAVRLATFPLNMQQIKSSKAMQELQPKMKALQEKYKKDREKLAQEQMALYKEHGVNPLGGCLPMLVQMPIWFALYQALLQLSREGLLTQGFFWIPSLGGPVADYSGGIGWLWPLPPAIGWSSALAYLVLPVLLVVSQLYMQQMMTPPTTDPQQASMQSIMKFMPLMFGYFALIVPSGLTLYWFTSNILAMVQQYFTKTRLSADTVSSEKSVVSSISDTPVPANSAPSSSGATISGDAGESGQRKHARSKRKKSKRKR